MQNVFLYDLDDLQKVADENLELRRREAEAAEKIIDAEVKLFDEWRKSLELTDTIVALRERFSELVRKEVTRSLPRLRDQAHSEYDPVEAFTQSLVNKLLHHPLTELKKGAHDPDGATVVEVTHRLFDLRRPESRTTTSSEPPQRREEDEPTEAPKRTRKDSL